MSILTWTRELSRSIWQVKRGGVLLPLLPCTETGRRVLSDPQPHGVEGLPPCREIYYWDACFYSLRSPAKHAEDVHGLEGCLPSRSNFSSSQEVHEVHVDVYQWRVLPFRLATAPRLFTDILGLIAAHLHVRIMPLYPYIDDIFHAKGGADGRVVKVPDSQTRGRGLESHYTLGLLCLKSLGKICTPNVPWGDR